MFTQNNSLNERVRELEAEVRELRADKIQLEQRLRYMRVILHLYYHQPPYNRSLNSYSSFSSTSGTSASATYMPVQATPTPHLVPIPPRDTSLAIDPVHYAARHRNLHMLQMSKTREGLLAEHPNLRLVTKEDWKSESDSRTRSSAKCDRFAFVTSIDGVYNPEAIQKMSREVYKLFEHLRASGKTALRWESLLPVARDYVFVEISELFPNLLNCCGTWRLDQFCSEKYHDWGKTRGVTNAGKRKLEKDQATRGATKRVKSEIVEPEILGSLGGQCVSSIITIGKNRR
jgi:hypothetical protein